MATPIDSCVSLMKETLVLPVPRYPSSVVTDASLKIAANQVTTTLITRVSSADTIFRVSDTSRLVVDMLLTVDSEIVSVSAIGSTGANNITVIRGFDGTVPSPHAPGRILAAYIDAWHHNALAAEVKAIETALGPNLSNITSQGGIVSTAYDWAQTIGGNLIVGNNSILLSPVPKGVNGSNTDHWLYISGGTGAAEAVLITGGTALSGAASGTIIVNCANTHSGSWTISSATAGIQEALRSISSGGAEIRIPAGPFTIHGPITVDVEGARILGTTRHPSSGLIRTSGIIFNVTAGTVEIANLALQGGGVAAPAGNIGIRTTGVRGYFHNLVLNLLYGGVLNAGGFHNVYSEIWARNFSGYVAKHTGGVGPFFNTITYDADTGVDVPVEGGILIHASGAYVSDVDISHCYYGVVVRPLLERLEWTFIYDARFDLCYSRGIYILNTSPYALEGVFMHDIWSVSTGLTGTFGGAPPTSGVGLAIENTGTGTINNVTIDGGEIFNSCEQNVQINQGRNVSLRGVQLAWANGGNKASIDNVFVNSPDRVELVGCTIGSNIAGGAAVRSGVLANAGTGDLLIRDCRFIVDNGAFTGDPITNLASVPAAVKSRGCNVGLDDVLSPNVIASAASVALPVRQYLSISGAAAISTITPVWQGRTIYVTKPDPGAWTTVTGGNIATAMTVNQGESAIFTYTGTKWIGVK